MLKTIDYENLESLTVNKGQNEIGENLQQLYEDIGPIKSLDDVKLASLYIRYHFERDQEMYKFDRTSEELAESKIYSGCSDFGTVLAPILRMNGIPTVYIQTGDVEWIKELQTGNPESIRGHIMLEVNVDNKWYLLDAINGKLYHNYDINNVNVPKNRVVFSKSLNGHEVGCTSFDTNEKVMKDYFSKYDVSDFIEPKYEMEDYLTEYRNRRLKEKEKQL